MSIGAVSSAVSQVAQAAEGSVQVVKKAHDQQKQDGEAAVSLIRSSGQAKPQQSTQGIDTFA